MGTAERSSPGGRQSRTPRDKMKVPPAWSRRTAWLWSCGNFGVAPHLLGRMVPSAFGTFMLVGPTGGLPCKSDLRPSSIRCSHNFALSR